MRREDVDSGSQPPGRQADCVGDPALSSTPQPCGAPGSLHSGSPPAPAAAPPCVVGLALKKDKRKKHISDKLVRMAAEEGIRLRFIDKELPLEEQGPFTAILQKVRKPGAPLCPLQCHARSGE